MASPVYILRVVGGPSQGRQTVLDGSVQIGRGSTDLDVDDLYASRHHAVVNQHGNEVTVADAGSKRGTQLNGVTVVRPTPVRAGDVITVGSSSLTLLSLDPATNQHFPTTASAKRSLQGSDGHLHPIPAIGTFTLGRDPAQCDLVIDHPTVSRRGHCVLRSANQGVAIDQVGDRATLLVNGIRVAGPRPLANGDVLTVGSSPVQLTLVDDLEGLRAPDELEPLALTVRLEGSGESWAVLLDAPPMTSCGAVFDAIAAYLGSYDPADHQLDRWYAYRAVGSVLIDRSTPWWAAPIERCDELVIATVDTISGSPNAGLHPDPTWNGPPPRTAMVRVQPRTSRPPTVFKATVPDVPEGTSFKGRGVGWQVGAGAASVCAGLVIALMTRPIIGLVFAMAGVVGISASIFGEQSRRRHKLEQFRTRVAQLDGELAQVVIGQRSALWDVAPEVATVAAWPAQRSPRVWERRPEDPDFLVLRLGRGSAPALIEPEEAWRRSDSPVAGELGAVLERYRQLSDVPITTPTQGAAFLGLAGEEAHTHAMARSLLIQAAVLHSPSDVSITVLATTPSWTWARWLPHLATPEGARLSNDPASASTLARGLTAELDAAVAAKGNTTTPAHHHMVLIAEGALGLSEVGDLLAVARQTPVQVVVLAGPGGQLPPQVDLEIDCRSGGARMSGRAVPAGSVAFPAEVLDERTATDTARALGRCGDPRSGARTHPPSRNALTIWGIDDPTAFDASTRWSTLPREILSVVIGSRDDGQPLEVAFRRNGPHALLAGMTGSGKSVLLQTLLAGLAVTHSPDLLNLFLVDYKGGSAFASLGDLPHTVGLVTDLESDRSLTNRALAALDAELRRRKQLFADAAVEKLSEYEALARTGRLVPLPNLLVVIDEYAALASDDANEEAVARLNQVAIQGRSLGVHMLLAMQSPQGVVSNAIQKNTNLWLCLRVVDGGESSTVIGSPAAALIPDSQPGRGYLRLGGGDHPVAFQTASVTAGDEGSSVVVAPFGDLQPPVATTAVLSSSGGKPLDALCAHLIGEAGRLALPEQRQLWLPPLPTMLPADEPALATDLPADRLAFTLGLADQPETQTQAPHVIDLSRSGNMLVVGELGSGKTTTLKRIAAALAAEHDAATCHLYGIEAGGGALAPLQQLPHTAAITAADDLERGGRLLNRLIGLLDARREQMAADGAGDWLRWRTQTASPQPWVVLLLDDYPVFREAVEDHRFGVMIEQYTRLLQSGSQVGIHLVVTTTQRADIRAAIINLFGARAVLRQADDSDYDLGGLRGRAQRGYEPPPGRALVDAQVFREVQVAWPPDESFGDLAAAAAPVPADERPKPIERLPKEVPLADILATSEAPDGRSVLLGIGGPELEPIVFDHATMGPHVLVLGDDLSGRTNVIRVALASAAADARVAVLLGRSSPLMDLKDDPRVFRIARADGDGAELLAEVVADPTVTHLVIDDAELIPSTLTSALDTALRSARDRDLHTVITARASDFGRMFDPWARYLLSFKTALLLMPSSDTASLLDIRLPRGEGPMPAGRGYLVQRGASTLIQVALADS